jgi:hypothetical protein
MKINSSLVGKTSRRANQTTTKIYGTPSDVSCLLFLQLKRLSFNLVAGESSNKSHSKGEEDLFDKCLECHRIDRL